MSTNQTMVALVAHECKTACDGITETTERIAAVMRAARDHFMAPDDESAFMGACCALYELSDEPTRTAIRAELEAIRFLNAMVSGVAVDLEKIPKGESQLGLMKAFHATKP